MKISIIPVGMCFAINDKNLDYEIETIDRFKLNLQLPPAINDKNLDYEIETRDLSVPSVHSSHDQ